MPDSEASRNIRTYTYNVIEAASRQQKAGFHHISENALSPCWIPIDSYKMRQSSYRGLWAFQHKLKFAYSTTTSDILYRSLSFIGTSLKWWIAVKEGKQKINPLGDDRRKISTDRRLSFKWTFLLRYRMVWQWNICLFIFLCLCLFIYLSSYVSLCLFIFLFVPPFIS